MAEYIEREALIERLEFKRSHDDWNNSKYRGLECAIAQVKKAPAADVVAVVRCRDCKNYKPGKHFTDINFCQRLPYYAEKGGLNTADDDFCSNGERKEK